MVRSLLLLSLLATPALADVPDEVDRPHRVVDGNLSSDWPATAALIFDGEAGCTGTLIDPAVVLTAAHCLDYGPPDSVYFGDAPGGDGEVVPVDRAVSHPSYVGDEGDVGLLFLAEDASPRPVPLDVQDAGRLSGEVITYVGFGDTQGSGGEGRKKEATARIVEVGDDILDVQPESGSACYGDSGGPLYFREDGVVVLVGVVAFGYTDDCRDLGGNTRVDKYVPWIEEETGGLAVAGDPEPEPEPEPDPEPDPTDDGLVEDPEGCTDAEWEANPEACDALEDRLMAEGDGCAAAPNAAFLLFLPLLGRRRMQAAIG